MMTTGLNQLNRRLTPHHSLMRVMLRQANQMRKRQKTVHHTHPLSNNYSSKIMLLLKIDLITIPVSQ